MYMMHINVICIYMIYIYVCIMYYVWMYGCMDGWMYACMDAWMHGCTVLSGMVLYCIVCIIFLLQHYSG